MKLPFTATDPVSLYQIFTRDTLKVTVYISHYNDMQKSEFLFFWKYEYRMVSFTTVFNFAWTWSINNVTVDLRKVVGWEGVDWIHLAQNWGQW